MSCIASVVQLGIDLVGIVIDGFRYQCGVRVADDLRSAGGYRSTRGIDALLVFVAEVDIKLPALLRGKDGATGDAFALGLEFETVQVGIDVGGDIEAGWQCQVSTADSEKRCFYRVVLVVGQLVPFEEELVTALQAAFETQVA